MTSENEFPDSMKMPYIIFFLTGNTDKQSGGDLNVINNN